MIKGHRVKTMIKEKSGDILFWGCIVILRIYYYIQNHMITYTNDSSGYIGYTIKDVITDIHERCPVYLFVNAISGSISTIYADHITVIFQMCMSLLAVLFLKKTLNLLLEKKWISYVFSFLYGVTAAVIGWDQCILTESITCSTFCVFLYMIVAYLKKVKICYGMIAIAMVLLMVYTRPSSLLFLYILFVFFLLRCFIYHTKTEIILFCSTAFVLITTLLYSFRFEDKYGLFAISDPMPRNLLLILMGSGLYENSPEKEFIERIDESLRNSKGEMTWRAMTDVRDQYSPKELQDICITTIMAGVPDFLKYSWRQFKECSDRCFYAYAEKKPDALPLFRFRIFKVRDVLISTIIEMILCFYIAGKKKEIPWIHLGIFGFVFSITLLTFLTSPGEYIRVMILVVPLLYIAFAVYIEMLLNLLSGNVIWKFVQ